MKCNVVIFGACKTGESILKDLAARKKYIEDFILMISLK